MWRLRSLVVLGILAGVLIFGATVAYAKWHWNARIDVEDTLIRTVWAVDEIGSPEDYHASIVVTLPYEAEVGDIELLPNEDVVIRRHGGLECHDDGIEAKIEYRVKALKEAKGNLVDVTIVTIDGQVLGEKTGKIGKKIKLGVVIPSDEPDCYQD